MKVFKFDVDEEYAKQHNEMIRDTRSLVASGVALFVISLLGAAAVWFFVDPESPWHTLGTFGLALFGLMMLVVGLLIPRSVGKTQELYDANPLAPAIITERVGTTITLTACAGGSTTASNDSNGGSESAESGDANTITFWSNHPGSSKDMEEELIAAFEEENPDLKVKLVTAGSVSYTHLTLPTNREV